MAVSGRTGLDPNRRASLRLCLHLGGVPFHPQSAARSEPQSEVQEPPSSLPLGGVPFFAVSSSNQNGIFFS
ncbi:Thioredoxin-like fold-containing protein [Dioscorea alata]|uniref:Thioredoxin-like fold-containing protein n=1 Tax=Dioscorea alata TaxID=55571 RepID=A0ACB7WPX5_DIOAL|nr:Thioredoxin-like fold-containing protein [Dioscorea alata]